MAVQFIESGKMDSSFRKLNSMLSLWYGIIVGSLQIYLIAQNVWKFVRFAELPWPSSSTPTIELNIFIGLNGVAVLLLPFFITASFLKIGNLANDNEMIGKRLRMQRNSEELLPSSSSSSLLSMWRHSGPISSLLHILISVSLLFPQTLMDAILIKHGFLHKDNIWKSDLDFLLSKDNDDEDMTIRPIGEGPSEFAKRVIPLTSRPMDGLRLEFINYAMALFIFTFRYAQVFWFSHKRFALLLGLQQILNNMHSLVSFSTLIVLYKMYVGGKYTQNTPFLLDGQMSMLIFAISLTVLFSSSSVLYYLGYLKFLKALHEKTDNSKDNSKESSFYGGGWAYFPHSAAVSIALALAAAQSPLVHDAFIVHQISGKRFLLLFPISAVIHFLLWAILWLCLTLKKQWSFNINATIIQEVDGLNAAEITIDLGENCPLQGPFSPSLVIISEGKAFSVENSQDQKSILALLPQGGKTIPTPTPSCLSYKHKGDKIKYMQCRKEVTFDDEIASPRYYSRAPSRCDGGKGDYSSVPSVPDFDSGEYAYLSGGHQSQNKNHHQNLQNQRSSRAESLYSPINFLGSPLNTRIIASPSSTVESNSGSSSSSSGVSSMGPPSTSASEVQAPTAHYEPVNRQSLSRRNSMRSTNNTNNGDDYQLQKRLVDDIYGKLGGKSVTDSIYSSSNKQFLNESIYGTRTNTTTTINNHVNEPIYISKKVVNSNDVKIVYGHLEEFCPPIPPPLPILECVVRNNYPSVRLHSPPQSDL